MGSLCLVATLLLAVVGSSCGGDGVPRHLSLIREMVGPRAGCTIGKFSCSADCNSIEICLGESLEVVKQCVAPKPKCDSPTMTCVAEGEEQCSGAVDPDKYTCRGPVGGRFPNPSDCHSYFVCPEPPETPEATVDKVECNPPPATTTTAYDPLSTTCRFKDTARVCKDGPVPECKTALQAGALIENPNIYYVCVPIDGTLQTWMAKCKDPTTIFQDGKCVSADL